MGPTRLVGHSQAANVVTAVGPAGRQHRSPNERVRALEAEKTRFLMGSMPPTASRSCSTIFSFQWFRCQYYVGGVKLAMHNEGVLFFSWDSVRMGTFDEGGRCPMRNWHIMARNFDFLWRDGGQRVDEGTREMTSSQGTDRCKISMERKKENHEHTEHEFVTAQGKK